LARYRELGIHSHAASALDVLGELALAQGDFAQARIRLEEARAWHQEMGLRVTGDTIDNLAALGQLAYREGAYARATALLTESLAIAVSSGRIQFRADLQRSLAAVARAQGEHAQALRLMRECLTAWRGLAWEKLDRGEALREMAMLCAALGQAEKAARLFAAAESVRTAIGSLLPPVARAEHEGYVAAVRQTLGDEAFAAAWNAGAALSLDQALDYALEDGGIMETHVTST